MNVLIQTIIGCLIAAMLAPYFQYALGIKKNKRTALLEKLEEAYGLAKDLKAFSTQTPTNLSLQISFLEYKKDLTQLPASIKSPVNRLCTILDYHLSAPDEYIKQIENLNLDISKAYGYIAHAINKPNEKDENYVKSISTAMEASLKGNTLSNVIVKWIKDEKTRIESEPTIFQLKYWMNTYSTCMTIKLKFSKGLLNNE